MAKSTKTKTKRITSITIRETRKGDRSPKWENTDGLSKTEFLSLWHTATQYYNVELHQKEYKPIVLNWMTSTNFDQESINTFKKIKEWRCSSTMACIADGLLKGMPNNTPISSTEMSTWLTDKINEIIIAHNKDEIDDTIEPINKPTPVDRIKEGATRIAESIDDVIDQWTSNPKTFKAMSASTLLNSVDAKASHAKYIKEFYATEMEEIDKILKGDGGLKEAYPNHTKKNFEAIYAFYTDLMAACDELSATKVRKARPIDKNKAVSALKYKKSDDILKLSSIDPVAIFDSMSLWVFDTKTRKLGHYVALEGGLSIKGCTIINFDPKKSTQKILRKPSQTLIEFDKASKTKKESFLSTINSTETTLNGRINGNVILLKL